MIFNKKMSSKVEEIAYNQENSLPDPKRIKLTNDLEIQPVKVKSCTTSENNNSTGALNNQQVFVLVIYFLQYFINILFVL